VEQVEMVIARQWHGKNVSVATDTDAGIDVVFITRHWHSKPISTATNQHTTVEELLEAVFSVWSTPRLCSKD
jgi:hypothetical protein